MLRARGDFHGDRGERVAAVDNLRALLVAWVIGGHALLGYAAIGGWPYDEIHEVVLDPRTEFVLTAVIGPSALFVIGTFFFLAGLFAPGQIQRHGPASFAWSRLLRLGVPWIGFTLVVWPGCMWLAYRAAGSTWTFGEAFLHRQPFLDSGPLWFAQILLYVSLAFAAWTAWAPPPSPKRMSVATPLWLGAVATITLSSYLVRIAFPARSQQILDLHVWQWPQCVGMFCVGVVVSRAGWIRSVPSRAYRLSGVAGLAVLVLGATAAAVLGVGGAPDGAQPYLGGGTWQSLVLAFLEAVLVVAGSVWLLGLAQRHLSTSGPIARACRRSAFAAYLLQVPVLLGLAIVARPISVPAEPKALAVAVVAVTGCFALGQLGLRVGGLTRTGHHLASGHPDRSRHGTMSS